MPTLPDITLKTVDFKPAVFTPVEYKMELADPTLPQKAIQLQELHTERADKAGQEFITKNNELYEALHPTERQWFKDQQQKIEDEIDYEASIGNTGTAYRIAINSARQLARDKSLQNKVLANAEFQKKIDAIEKDTTLDYETKRYFKAHNDYYDDGTGTWEAKVPVESDISENTLYSLVDRWTAEQYKSENTARNNTTPELYDFNNNVIEQDDTLSVPVGINKVVTDNWRRGETHRKRTEKQLLDSFNDLLKNTGNDVKLQQKFRVNQWAIKDYYTRMNDASLSDSERNNARQKYNELSRTMLNKDGMVYSSYEDWLAGSITPMLKNMAYDHTTTEDSTTNGVSYSSEKLANNRAGEADRQRKRLRGNTSTTGTSVRVVEKPSEPSDNTDASAYAKRIQTK